MKKREKLLLSIIVNSIIGLIASLYTTYAHFNVEATAICTINDTFSCDIVNQSHYSEIFGIPVAILGLLAYIFFIAFAGYYRKNLRLKLSQLAVGVSVMGVLFSAYLSYIEAYVLNTWCIFCLASQFAIIGIMISSIWLYKTDSKNNK